MFGITQENIVFICTIMAAILHILLLCSFTWTLIEGMSKPSKKCFYLILIILFMILLNKYKINLDKLL